MNLYKYTTWQPFDNNGNLQDCYTRNNLINNQLHFSSIQNFNDPFDVCPYLNIKCTGQELLEIAKKFVVKNNKGLKGKQAIQRAARELISTLKLENIDVRRDRAKLIADKFNKIGICCFTTNSPETTLMWSHYADGHKGICLIFIPSGTIRLFGDNTYQVVGPIKVNYDKKLPTLDLFNMTSQIMAECIKTKSIDWEYEHEYRVFTPGFTGEKKWNARLLSAIVAGCKMHNKEFEVLKQTISKMKNVKPILFRAEKKEQEFGFALKQVEL